MRTKALAVAAATAIFVTLVGHEAFAQNRIGWQITDRWGNALEGVQVEAKRPDGGGAPWTEVTDKKGEFLMVGLDSTEYQFIFRLEGYQSASQIRGVGSTGASPGRRRRKEPPIELDLALGGQFLANETEFESEGGTPNITLKPDGMFEFKDADGEGEGNYALQDLNVVLTVRDYDGKDDDRYMVKEPVVVTAPDNSFLSLVWGETMLKKKRK